MYRKSFVLSGLRISAVVCLFVITMIAAFNLSGCGGSSAPISLTVTPATATADGSEGATAAQTVTLTAAVTNDKSTGSTPDGVTWTSSVAGVLSNTSTTGATFTAPAATSAAQTVTITATSVGDTTKTGTATITVPALLASTTTTAQLTAAVGTVYSQQLTVSGGNGTDTWSTTLGGTPPPGWTITSGGLLSGPVPTAGQAGAYPFTVAVHDSGTYSTTLSLTGTISAAPAITFTGIMPLTGTYGMSYSGTSTATGGAGTLNYTLVSGALPTGVTPTVAGNYSAISGTPTAVGPFNFTIKAADNFGDSNTQAYTVTIGQETPTLAFATIATQTYSAATVTASASDTGTAGSPGTITYSVTSGPASINSSTGVVTLTGAGTVNLKAIQAATTDFAAPTPATTSFTVNKAAASITVTPYTVTYDGNAHTANVTATGIGGANLASDVTLNTTHTSASSYTTDSWSFTDPTGNYAPVSTTTITDTINQANATINVTPYSVVYDGTAYTATGTATGLGGANLNADLNLAGTTHTSAGTYTTDSWSFTDSSGNYASKTGTVNDLISGASAIVNLGSLSQTYSGSPISATATTVPTGQTVTFTYTGTGYPTSANPPTNAGSYTVVGTISNANYSGSSTGTLIISPATASITVTPYTVTYNGSAHTATGTATGVGGANLNADLNLSNTTHTNAGSYTTDTWSFTDPNGNYSPVSATTITDTINQATPTLAFASIATQTYSSVGQTVNSVASSASSGTITYSVTSGPASINSANGVVTLTGSGTVNLQATQIATTNYAAPTAATTSFTVNTAALVLTPSLPTAAVGQSSYSGSVTASGGVGPYTWTVNGTPYSGSVSLGNGLSATLNAGGTALNISGSPTTTTSVTLDVSISDSQSTPATQTSNNSITVTAFGLTIGTPPPAFAVTGSSYSSGTFTATGGTGPYTWSIVQGSGFSYLPIGPGLGNTSAATNAITGTVTSNDPTGAYNFTVQVVDNTTHLTATYPYTLTVYNPLSLTAPSSTVPGPAIYNTAYTGSTIIASGGSGNYSWSLNSSLPAGWSYSNPTGNSLVVSGMASYIPTTPSTMSFYVTLTDTTTGITTGQIGYSISVGPATPLTLQAGGSLSSATMNSLYNGGINSSGGSGSGYVFSINGTAVPTDGTPVLISDSIYVFYNGGNSLNINGTPTQAGTVTLTNVTVTDGAGDNAGPDTYTITVNPIVPTGYTVSGTVNYSGTNGGWVYLELIPNNGCSGCSQNLGTAIDGTAGGPFASPKAYTIHGVPAGTYTLKAYMDGIGYGLENASDPTGSLSNLNVTSSGLSNQNFTLADPATVTLGTATPTWDPSNGSGVFSGGAVVSFDPICNGSGCNNGGVEMPTSYNLEYSTDPTFNSGFANKHFTAQGGNSPWIVTGLITGQTYYFRAAGLVGSTSGNYSAAAPTHGLLIGAPSTGSLLSGTVTFAPPAGVTLAGGPLYVGCYASGTIYAERIASPVSPQAYSVLVPDGTNCQVFGFLDQNSSGLIGGPGELSNTSNGVGMISVTVNGATPNQNITLPSSNSVVEVKTQTSTGSGGTNYGVGFQVYGEFKLPVAVELLSPETPNVPGTVADVVLPVDIATDAFNNYNNEFDYWPQVTGTPVVGDTYTFKVTYADGSSENLNAAVTGVLNAFATNLSPAGTGVSLTPNFSWDYPSSASSYVYQFELDANNQTIWEIPQKHGGSNGFASTISPFITWDVDPTNSGDLPSSSYLTSGGLHANTSYDWSIAAYDANMNEAQVSVNFITGTASLSLPAGNTGYALINTLYEQSLNASGGSGSGVFTVNGTPIPSTGIGNAVAINNGDGLSAYSTGSNTLYIFGTPTTAGNVSLTVSVIDSFSDTTSQTYTINVATLPTPGASNANNAKLNGTYVCKSSGYDDASGARWATLSTVIADGNGNFTTGGTYDTNTRDLSAAISGGYTGTYNIGVDNNGIANMTATVPGFPNATSAWAIALTGSGSVAQEFRKVRIDDVGATPSGIHGGGDCYKATTSAFASSTLSGNNFAFGMQGENGNGTPKAYLGRMTLSTESSTGGTGGAAGGTITSGILDGMRLDQTADNGGTFTGSYTVPNSNTGRFTLTFNPGGSSVTFAAYTIDANRMFMLETAGDSGLMAGDMRTQQQSANTAAALLNGSSVLYSQRFDGNSSGIVTGYGSSVYQASSTGNGTMTVNASYDDDEGTYKTGNENGAGVAITLDSANPGRATFSPGGGGDSAFLYFFNAGSAFYLDLNGSNHNLQTGWLEAQTQTQPNFTNAALAGDYLLGKLPSVGSDHNDATGEFDLLSNGSISGGVTTGGEGDFTWDQAMSGAYSWASTTYGTLTTGTGDKDLSCAVISSTKVICITNGSSSGEMMILQQ
jgi:hypothetical protein